jgi:preprotein translocase subunit SecE
VSETRGATATPERRSPRPASGGKGNPAQRISLFYRQVVAELRKVIWPTRKELITYTTVALFFVVIMIAIVALLDLGFAKAVLKVFG